MGKDIFKRYPEKRGEEKDKSWKGRGDFLPKETEKSPEKSQKKDQEDINKDAKSNGKMAIMSGDRRDPVNQDGVV